MISLIDGDMVMYMAAFANQMKIDLGDGLGDEPIVNEREAVNAAIRLVNEWTRKSGGKSAIVCLSSVESDSFRHRIWPAYKANRTKGKPEAYEAVRNAIETEFETYAVPGLEADDLMGIAGTSEKAQSVIVSRDKDMKTVPALVFNPDFDKKPVKINRMVADQMWMMQTMVGDTVDNYPGIPGVGPINAQKILLSPHRLVPHNRPKGKKKTVWRPGEATGLWQSMVDYAAKAGMSEEELVKMAQVSRILRTGDYNEETRTVRLWRPSGFEELALDA
jgi:5'-3' exonuclease